MRRLPAVLLAGILALTGCSLSLPARSRADQDRDARVIAAALQAADEQGVSFSMSLREEERGGTIPSGNVSVATAEVQQGRLKNRQASFQLRFTSGSKGSTNIVVDGPTLYIQSKTATWNSASTDELLAIAPATRLDLVAEAVLLAPSVGGVTVGVTTGGLVRHYQVRPAIQQLAQLLGLGNPADLAGLDKVGNGGIDVALSYSDRKLTSVDVSTQIRDPASSATRAVDCLLSVRFERIGPIAVPTGATPLPSPSPAP